MSELVETYVAEVRDARDGDAYFIGWAKDNVAKWVADPEALAELTGAAGSLSKLDPATGEGQKCEKLSGVGRVSLDETAKLARHLAGLNACRMPDVDRVFWDQLEELYENHRVRDLGRLNNREDVDRLQPTQNIRGLGDYGEGDEAMPGLMQALVDHLDGEARGTGTLQFLDDDHLDGASLLRESAILSLQKVQVGSTDLLSEV